MEEHKCFQGENICKRNERTGVHGIDYVLKLLDGDDLNKDKIKKRYDDFELEYKRLTNQTHLLECL